MDSNDELIRLINDIAFSAIPAPRKELGGCPKCGGDLCVGRHRFDDSGGAPDCSWLYCLACDYQAEPE